MRKNEFFVASGVRAVAYPRFCGLLIFCGLLCASAVRAAPVDTLRAYFLSGDYKACIREGERVLAGASSSKGLDELYCILGLSYLKDGNYLRASDIFEIVLHEYRDSRFSDEARLGLGDSYFLRSDFKHARSMYETLLKEHARTKLKAGVYYRLSLLGKRTHDRALEQEYRDRLKTEFPQSPEALAKKELFPAGVAYASHAAKAIEPVIARPAPVIEVPKTQPALQPAEKVFAALPQPGAEASLAQPEQDEVQSLTMAAQAYSIQVGAFSSRTNAQNLAQKLNAKGYSAFIVQATFNARPLFKVRVGHFSSLGEAKKAEQRLRQSDYPTKIIP